jgi:hypothetical protein
MAFCERFHKTLLQEFYQVACPKKTYRSLEETAEWRVWTIFYSNPLRIVHATFDKKARIPHGIGGGIDTKPRANERASISQTRFLPNEAIR